MRVQIYMHFKTVWITGCEYTQFQVYFKLVWVLLSCPVAYDIFCRLSLGLRIFRSYHSDVRIVKWRDEVSKGYSCTCMDYPLSSSGGNGSVLLSVSPLPTCLPVYPKPEAHTTFLMGPASFICADTVSHRTLICHRHQRAKNVELRLLRDPWKWTPEWLWCAAGLHLKFLLRRTEWMTFYTHAHIFELHVLWVLVLLVACIHHWSAFKP